MLNPPGLSGEPLKRMFMDAYAVGFLYMFRHGWSVPMLHTMATILVQITAIRPVTPYHLVYCLMRDKPPDLILSSLLKKIYILPLTEVVTLNLRDMLLTEETAKIPVASNPADKSFICAKHHDFNDQVGDDVWQRGNNNGFSSWEDE